MESFVSLGREFLTDGNSLYLLSAKLNQDPLEEYFSKQRALSGVMENPDVRSFAYNHLKLVVVGSSAVRASVRGNSSLEDFETRYGDFMLRVSYNC